MSRIKPSRLTKRVLLLFLVLVVVSGSILIYFLYPLPAASFRRVADGGVAVIDGLSDLSPNPSFEQTVTEFFDEAGMYVDLYNSSSVTVDFMKSFPAGYHLIIFRVHSGTSRHGVFYFTSEPYDEAKYQAEQYRDELRPAKDYEGHSQVFAFGAKFVDTYLQGRFNNAIIIGMGCFGAGTSYGTGEEVEIENVVEKGPNLADAFHRQGATAVIGWDLLVTLGFSDEATLRLIRALAAERLTVKDATERVNLEIGPDPTYKSRLTFYPDANGDKTLLIQPRHGVTETTGNLCMQSDIAFSAKAKPLRNTEKTLSASASMPPVIVAIFELSKQPST